MKPLIIITGASSGIGMASAKRLSAAGHPLLLLARRLAPMEALSLPNTLCKAVDIQDIQTFQKAIDEAEARFGSADLLINNAGVMLLGHADTQDISEWEQMFDVNVKGLLNGIHLLLAPMKARKRGTIINISSVAGRKLYNNHSIYCGTKFAVSAMSDGIREEMAPFGVRVISICPGAVETELLGHTTSQTIKDNYENWKKEVGGALSSDDVARAVQFAYEQPQNVCIREIALAATGQGA